jgi:GNAT superfamily N-acetyltransferase
LQGRRAPYPAGVRCYVEPSPAGGYFVRLRGEPAPVSHHDTEEEAQAAAAAYERGLEQASELVVLRDGSEVLVRALGDDAIGAFADGRSVGVARYVPDATRPHVAEASVVVDEVFRGRGLSDELIRRLRAHAARFGIREFV